MRPGEVFLAGDYAERIANGSESLPEEAKSGTYALGTAIMVAAASLGPEYGLPDLPEWFPARVCLPPPIPGQWYRWYDPFIWYETEGPIHVESEHSPANMAYVGKKWYPPYVSKYDGKTHECTDFWAAPVDVWRKRFGGQL